MKKVFSSAIALSLLFSFVPARAMDGGDNKEVGALKGLVAVATVGVTSYLAYKIINNSRRCKELEAEQEYLKNKLRCRENYAGDISRLQIGLNSLEDNFKTIFGRLESLEQGQQGDSESVAFEVTGDGVGEIEVNGEGI